MKRENQKSRIIKLAATWLERAFYFAKQHRRIDQSPASVQMAFSSSTKTQIMAKNYTGYV